MAKKGQFNEAVRGDFLEEVTMKMLRGSQARGRTREGASEVKVRTNAKAGRVRQIGCFQKQKERERAHCVGVGGVEKSGGEQCYLRPERPAGGQGRGQGKELGFKCSVGSRWGF